MPSCDDIERTQPLRIAQNQWSIAATTAGAQRRGNRCPNLDRNQCISFHSPKRAAGPRNPRHARALANDTKRVARRFVQRRDRLALDPEADRGRLPSAALLALRGSAVTCSGRRPISSRRPRRHRHHVTRFAPSSTRCTNDMRKPVAIISNTLSGPGTDSMPTGTGPQTIEGRWRVDRRRRAGEGSPWRRANKGTRGAALRGMGRAGINAAVRSAPCWRGR